MASQRVRAIATITIDRFHSYSRANALKELSLRRVTVAGRLPPIYVIAGHVAESCRRSLTNH